MSQEVATTRVVARCIRAQQAAFQINEEWEFVEVRAGVVAGEEAALPSSHLPDITFRPESGHYPFDHWLFSLLLATAFILN